MLRGPPRSNRLPHLFPTTTLFRSHRRLIFRKGLDVIYAYRIILSECRRNVFENAGGVEAFDALINRTERIDRIIVQEIVEFSARFHRIDVRAKKLFDVGLGHLESSLFSFVEFLLQFREFFVLLLKIDQSLETFGSRAGEKVLDAPVSEI